MAVFKGNEIFQGTVDMSAVTALALPAGLVTQAAQAASAISPVADAACAILSTTTEINLTVSAAGTVVISTTSSVAGQQIFIRAAAVAGGGSYTLAVTGGTLTFNSTGECAVIQRNAANSAWIALSLTAGAAGGAPATIV